MKDKANDMIYRDVPALARHAAGNLTRGDHPPLGKIYKKSIKLMENGDVHIPDGKRLFIVFGGHRTFRRRRGKRKK